ncbi:restriction endonuclease [Pandoraea apista]|uniref:restriction endonuclease n=1 Tax=Pandoraea apista TaxID=93218 RepID=UPI000F67D244|nr:restriction endonuclease [Pandoraea apista]RRW87690.1 hypothetical protein EGJ54_25350 [Pandoraea apista]RRW96179.1 hypothetical protein EGJ56_25365 [Pandoraea apista]
MATSFEAATLPPFYNGRVFPVDQLSSSEFEDFVFACLQGVSEIFELVVTGQPSGSGDGGFDVQARNTRTGRIACVQCKRQKDPLGTPQVAEELAKVAATAALEGSDVGEHRFICTGGVRSKLVRQLREKSRQSLAEEAVERIVASQDSELTVLRERLQAENFDVREVVHSYVTNLDVLLAWSFREFDVALSARWSAILPIAERFFSIAAVVREHPRASFDRAAYVKAHRSFDTALEPRLRTTSLPGGISASSAADPGAKSYGTHASITTLDQFCELEAGSLTLLTGDGGAGKSAALKLIRARAMRSSEATLAVIVSLSTYVAGRLDHAIHQELGVDSGSWRSLPDRVLLLCDGLNECPASNVNAFLSELGSLLQRNRISCVISTRESIGRIKIVLPQAPLACIGLDEITPRGIRRIAERELGDDIEGFVVEYRALADASYSRLLWTPFSVMVALDLWRTHSSLPSTLGEMLAALLLSRCDRNIEISERQYPAEVVQVLSEAVAFQCLIMDGRLDCPAVEAGRWIRKAKTFCGDALGIADLTETQVIEILIDHNLIHRSPNGHFSFDHQLVAGALTARLLSRSWRNHVNCLDDTLSDDAWVFAARLVPTEEVLEYLTTVFNRDLLLGARVARELPLEHQARAESLLDQCFELDAPEQVQINAAFALALLGSKASVLKLKNLATDQTSPISQAVQRALAATGDPEFLISTLIAVDRIRSTPIQMSGGEVDIWDHAPLPKRLDVVRQRLLSCPLGEPVAESLRLVAFERDAADIPIIEKHLDAARDLSAWGGAIYALRIVAPERARIAVERCVADTSAVTGRARLLRVAAKAGVPIDIAEAFRCAIADLSTEAVGERDNLDLILLVSDVIGKMTLSLPQVSVLEQELPNSIGDRRARLWQLAVGCHSARIADYAASCISNWTHDSGSACRYFIEHPDLADVSCPQLIEHCERAVEREQDWYDWATTQAMELLLQLGCYESMAKALAAMLKRAARITVATREGTQDTLDPGDLACLHTLRSECPDIHFGLHMVRVIRLVARARMHLPQSALLCLLSFDFHISDADLSDLRRALSDVPDAVVDQELAQVRDLSTLLSGLLIVCYRGLTPTRLALLERGLAGSYCHPAGMHRMQRAMDACWCPDVLQMVLKFVSGLDVWSEYDSQFFWDFARLVARRVREEDCAAIEHALGRAKTEFAARILLIWRTQALGGRVGLSTLALSSSILPTD